MSQAVNQSQTAKYTLLLVLVVIFVCSGQNFGYTTACTANDLPPSKDSQSVDATPASQQMKDSAVHGKCSLSDHLLQMHQHSVEHAIISLFIVVLALLIYAAFTQATPIFTEPIPPTRRRHLTLCVFRE
ncbi:hypothetical protein ACQKPX_12835 [Photobacterium sp. DNB23_23_1]|uniref:Copper resistance protein n=1 Tax=Photobacterium pectinilyticum TaxID=2906793 RepID=A0ABT1N6J5_9GAMM|nr:hypothetical protein [Photobacterium sp. ZSDE20]MCQ1060367.1 hypothetical protein [Photobacterium sp. ZSDE20]MDD1826899.1 hypothetical protein [Photobacterium sp. ZSDE20]